MLDITLPFPVSTNTYYRNVGHMTIISKRGRQYRKVVVSEIERHCGKCDPLTGRVSMALYLSRGDKRKYDISNYIKALEDCFTHAGVWLDDEQVDQLGVYRLPVEKPGTVRVTIEELLS